ncbi:hypothetical protein HT136_15565 [Novosphingobium profundi]|uniref:DUF6491 family protein n=1 Tax=Novosphingobium profundi TaxID=1774954 RepID=UPI001BDA13A0|nr:DUF6491 family protein [Novosphingobium profundi]MBT0669785.1 hypothetical protein [Novosphingobium profundi]
MRLRTLFLSAGLMALAPTLCAPAMAASASAQPAAQSGGQKGRAASIPFANHGGVQDWRADGTRAVYFKDNHRQWYRADLIGTATDLPFVENIGIISGPGGALDRFGGVLVKGQRYMFSAFQAVDGPPAKKAHKTR